MNAVELRNVTKSFDGHVAVDDLSLDVPGGSIYGFDQPPGEATVFRLPPWGPFRGLYFAGAWTPPPLGSPPRRT